jgi:hypothetical protein
VSGRNWASFRLGGGFRLIFSKTGPRVAFRGKHVQVSPRSTYVKVGPFHHFAARKPRH